MRLCLQTAASPWLARSLHTLLLSVVLSASVASSVHAQADTTRSTTLDSIRKFDPVVVTAARRDERRSDAIVSTQVVSRADIRDAGASDIAAILTQELGLQLATGSPAGSQILLQGLGEQRVLVLLDGQPLSGRVGGAFDLSRIPTSIVDRIEIVKGPQSVLYGTDAMGGVINIITRGPGAGAGAKRTVVGDASAIAGSHDRLDLSTRVAGSFAASVPFGIDLGHNHVALAPGLGTETGAYADRWNVAPRVRLSALKSLSFDVGGLGIFERQRYRTGQLSNFSDNTQTAANVGAAWTLGGAQITPTVAYSGFDHLSRSAAGSRPASDSGARDVQRLLTGTLNFSGIAGGMLLDAGTELRHESLVADRVPGVRRSDAAAVFAQTTWVADRISIVPGARASWSEQWGSSVTPRLALLARPLGGDAPLTIRASVGAGFRSPDFKELYLHFVNATAGYAVDGNADLRPERSVNTTAEVEWSGRVTDLRANVFHNRVHDLIETVGPDNTGTFTYDNVGLATTAGGELELAQHVGSGEIDLGYSYLHTRDLSAGGPILGRAAHSGRAAIRAETWRQLRVALTGLYTGPSPLSLDAAGSVRTTRQSLTQLNVRVARRFVTPTGSAAELSIGADNVFDTRREANWPGFTGRQLSIGLSWAGR